MVYTLSYSNIHDKDVGSVGARASFLARVANKGINTSFFFVVTSDALKKFFEYNSLKDKINELLREEEFFWEEFQKVFSSCSFPEDVKKDIKESYDALSISNSDVSNILRSFEARVNVLISCEKNHFLDGVFLSIKGFDNLLNAIKSSWFLSIKSKGLDFIKAGSFDFSVGVLVEKFVSPDFSVEVELSSNKKNILLHVYKGLPEISEGIVKDVYVLSFNHLEFISYELNSQNFSILHQEESGVLLKKRLGKEGSDNKASKQVISECARFSKRVFDIFDVPVRLIFQVKKDVPYVFLVDKFEESFSESSLGSDKNESFDLENFSEGEKESFSSEEVSLSEPVLEEESSESSSLKSDSSDFLEEEKDVFEDSDEFIVQSEERISSSENEVFSSFFNLAEVLEEDLMRSYKESFGLEPGSLEEAIYELDSKHGFSARDKILRVLEVKSLIMQGEEVDEDIISSLIGVMEDFLKKEGDE